MDLGGALVGGCDLCHGLCCLCGGGWSGHRTDCSGTFQHSAALWDLGECDRGPDKGICGYAECDFGCRTCCHLAVRLWGCGAWQSGWAQF